MCLLFAIHSHGSVFEFNSQFANNWSSGGRGVVLGILTDEL